MKKCFITSLAVSGAVLTASLARAEAPVERAPGAPAEGAATPLEEAPLPGAVPKGALKAVPGGLVADQIATAAMRTSHEARSKDADVVAAEAAARQAWLNYFPRFSTAATYTRLSPITLPPIGSLPDGTPITLPVFLNNASFVGTLAVPLTDLLLRIPQAHASAKTAANAARYTAEATRLQIGTEARVTYYNWVRTRLQTLVATLALEQAKAHLAVVVAHESPADIARVESQIASMDLVVEKARNYASILEDRLRTVMHDTSGKVYELGENIGDELAPFPVSPLGVLWDEAKANRLEVKALGEMVESNRQQSLAAKAGGYPRLDAIGNVTAANPNPRIFPPVSEFRGTWDVSLRLSWSPNDMASSFKAGEAVDARQASFEAQREALLDGLRSEVTATYTAVREADVAASTTLRGLRSAEESYRIRNALFKVGRATSVEMTDAEADLTRARVEAVGARIEQRIARARLLHALGRDVPGSKPAEVRPTPATLEDARADRPKVRPAP